jgi:hypothetical protein
MSFSSLIVFKGLLKNEGVKEQASLLGFLSNKMKELVENTPPIFVPLEGEKFFFTNLLSEIHWSWMIPFFETLSMKEKELILYALDETAAKKLQNYFKIHKSNETPSLLAIDYFKTLLFTNILEEKKNLLPIAYLPDSEMNLLLEFSKNELITLIDYLPLYDLSTQMHKIVDPKILKMIDSSLDENKKLFLKSKSSYKETFSFPPLKLSSEKKDFELTLHKRGINRMAKALSFHDESLTWYLAHKLDFRRGKALLKLSKEKVHPEIAVSITLNIIDLIPIIKNKEKKVFS